LEFPSISHLYSISDKHCENYASDISQTANGCHFTWNRDKKEPLSLQIGVFGLHNVSNALAAAVSAELAHVSDEDIVSGLSKFNGTKRRLERIGTWNTIPIFDDYAHHPTEIAASLRALRTVCQGRILLAFQVHTYSRLKAFYADFAQELSQADQLFLLPVYAAREEPNGFSSEQMAIEIPRTRYCEDFSQLIYEMRQIANPNDLLVFMGAGDITIAAHKMARN
jgi:UDP-N-acetylmuramate--alanine ligase